MNVAILIGRFPPGALGGAEHQAEGWARRLADRHRVTVVTRHERPGPCGAESRDGFTLIRLPVSRVPLWRAWLDLRSIDRTVGGMRPQPDVLLCFQTFISGYAGVRLKRRLGIPAIVWIRGEGEFRMARSRRNRYLGPRVWEAADAVLVQSEENRVALLEELDRYAPGARGGIAAKLDVVPNGLDLPEHVSAPPIDGPVLAVGRLIREKGMDMVIEALAGSGRRLVIAGAGPERERLEALARARSVEARFEGFVTRDRLAALYRDCACVVLASRRGEGLPNVLLEAMAHGRPVVATRISGVCDLVSDGANGLLVPADDVPALRTALARVWDDPALAVRLASAARATAMEFSWDHVRPRLEAVLARCVA